MKNLERIKNERFQYHPHSQEIVDNLTGFTYHCNNRKLVELLNKVNTRADLNAERYWNLRKQLD